MSRISKLFGIVTTIVFPANDAQRQLKPAAARKLDMKHEPILVAADWQEIEAHLQAEVRGLVSKSLIESIYGAFPVVSPEEQDVLLQTAVNRLYADVLYEILSIGVTPPFEPAEEILRWAENALDDALHEWQREDNSVEYGQYEPPIEDEQSKTKAILDALRRASRKEVLQEAANKRVQAETAMVTAE